MGDPSCWNPLLLPPERRHTKPYHLLLRGKAIVVVQLARLILSRHTALSRNNLLLVAHKKDRKMRLAADDPDWRGWVLEAGSDLQATIGLE